MMDYPDRHYIAEVPESLPDESAATQPMPEDMRFLRILELPEHRIRYVPSGDTDPSAVIVVGYDEFMSVVRELAGSNQNSMRQYGQKLELAIRHEAAGNFQAQVERQVAAAHAEYAPEIEGEPEPEVTLDQFEQRPPGYDQVVIGMADAAGLLPADVVVAEKDEPTPEHEPNEDVPEFSDKADF